MADCHICEGPAVKCEVCHHRHCDNETCPGYPIECAGVVQAVHTVNEED